MGRERRCRTAAGGSRNRRKKLIGVLRWQNQWGTHLKAWQKQFDEGRNPPRQFFERPEVEPHLQEHWLAFINLATERHVGMGVGPIPRSKIKDYATDELGLAGDAHDQFCSTLGMVDDDYVSMVNSTKKPQDSPSAIPLDDAEGMKAMFDRIGGRKKEAIRKDQAKV